MAKVYLTNYAQVIDYVSETTYDYDLPWNVGPLVERIMARGLRERTDCLTWVPGATDPQGRPRAYEFTPSEAAGREMTTTLRTVRDIIKRSAGDPDDVLAQEARAWLKGLPKMSYAAFNSSLAQWRSRRCRQGRQRAETMARCAPEYATYDGYVFERIVSVKALRAVGRRLRNCVGTSRLGGRYVSALRDGELAFWVLRKADDAAPLALVTVRLLCGTITEAKAHANARLPLETAEAFRRFCRDHTKAEGGIGDLGIYGGFVTEPGVVLTTGELLGTRYELAIAGTTLRIALGTEKDVRFGFRDARTGTARYAVTRGPEVEEEEWIPILLHASLAGNNKAVLAELLGRMVLATQRRGRHPTVEDDPEA